MSASVTCREVVKRFGPTTVLDGINLAIAPGEAIAIVGRSGCGKSTLLRMIAGLEAVSDGTIAIDGRPLSGINRQARVMFQDACLFPWKRLIDNVALGLPPERRDVADWALDQVGLGKRARDWPAVLSGGQRQRVSLARALASHPPLLLLDEPLGALDALTRLDMQTLIEGIWRQIRCSLVLVTHDVDEAVVLADRVLVMDHGRWVAEYRVDLPRPRDRADPGFADLRNRILSSVCHDPARTAV